MHSARETSPILTSNYLYKTVKKKNIKVSRSVHSRKIFMPYSVSLPAESLLIVQVILFFKIQKFSEKTIFLCVFNVIWLDILQKITDLIYLMHESLNALFT